MSEDCIAVGFSGEGRCIEPAVKGDMYCESHAGKCRVCGCEMDDHNDPRQGGGCTACGDCEGWL